MLEAAFVPQFELYVSMGFAGSEVSFGHTYAVDASAVLSPGPHILELVEPAGAARQEPHGVQKFKVVPVPCPAESGGPELYVSAGHWYLVHCVSIEVEDAQLGAPLGS